MFFSRGVKDPELSQPLLGGKGAAPVISTGSSASGAVEEVLVSVIAATTSVSVNGAQDLVLPAQESYLQKALDQAVDKPKINAKACNLVFAAVNPCSGADHHERSARRHRKLASSRRCR